MRTPYEIERIERERVAVRKPALAMPRWIPRLVPKAEPELYVWRDLADLVPVDVRDEA